MWYFMLHSGVHPTLTGVMLAFAIPFQTNRRHYFHIDFTLASQARFVFYSPGIRIGKYIPNHTPVTG